MKVIYTRHSEEKLTRTDIRKFKINKKLIEKILKNKVPVALEILHASKFFNIVSKELPKEVKAKYFASA